MRLERLANGKELGRFLNWTDDPLRFYGMKRLAEGDNDDARKLFDF